MKIFLFQQLSFFWNLSANVGLSSINNQDDVEFVQFALSLMAKHGKLNGNRAAKEACSQVIVGMPCDGRRGDVLVDAIVAVQAARGGPQDGHVSVMTGATAQFTERGVKGFFLAVPLNNNLLDIHPDRYPRLDTVPGCPPALKASIARHFVR